MLPFTFILMALVTLAGLWTETHRKNLPLVWMEKIGFAPKDLWVGRFERVLVSTFFTDSRRSLIQALLMTLMIVGTAEWGGGTLRAILTFWGVHILTLIAVSLGIVLPLHRMRFSFGTELALVRDVGPSAGYFGCLGYLLLGIPLSWRLFVIVFTFSGLVFVFFRPPRHGESSAVKKHADLAHILGLFLGLVSGLVWPS